MGAAIYIPVPDPDCRDVTNRSDQVQIKTGMLYNINQKNAKFQQKNPSQHFCKISVCLWERVQSFLSTHSCPSDDSPPTLGKKQNQKTYHLLLQSTAHGSFFWASI